MDAVAPGTACQNCGTGLEPADSGGDWDGKWMCTDCIRSTLTAEFGDLVLNPEESLHSGFVEALWRGVRSALIGSAIGAGTIFVLFLLIRFSFQLAQVAAGNQFAAPDPETWLLFLGFAWAFIGIVMFPLVVCLSLTSRKRTIAVREGCRRRKSGRLRSPSPNVPGTNLRLVSKADAVFSGVDP